MPSKHPWTDRRQESSAMSRDTARELFALVLRIAGLWTAFGVLGSLMSIMASTQAVLAFVAQLALTWLFLVKADAIARWSYRERGGGSPAPSTPPTFGDPS